MLGTAMAITATMGCDFLDPMQMHSIVILEHEYVGNYVSPRIVGDVTRHSPQSRFYGACYLVAISQCGSSDDHRSESEDIKTVVCIYATPEVHEQLRICPGRIISSSPLIPPPSTSSFTVKMGTDISICALIVQMTQLSPCDDA
jgi:hypothetical protein